MCGWAVLLLPLVNGETITLCLFPRCLLMLVFNGVLQRGAPSGPSNYPLYYCRLFAVSLLGLRGCCGLSGPMPMVQLSHHGLTKE